MNDYDELIKDLQLIADASEFHWVAEIIDRTIKTLKRMDKRVEAEVAEKWGVIDAWRDNESQRNERLQVRVDELEGRGKCPDCGIQIKLLGTVEIPACYCPDENCAWASWLTQPSEDEL
ncbi:MAG: hypothetical protein GY820_48355 [Gammaproteobacteria bacterium]|nr:hypothetical protein [Gammaproteobacteria bacterium]